MLSALPSGSPAAPRALRGDDVAVIIMYTSGTTGHPKGHMRTQGNFWTHDLNEILLWDMASSDVKLTFAPLFHVGGLLGGTMSTLLAGGHLAPRRAFDVAAALAAIPRYKVTVSFGVISSAYLKDAGDPAGAEDNGTAEYLGFMKQRFLSGNPGDLYCLYGYTSALVLMQVLKQAGGDLSRANIMRQAESLKDFEVPTLLPRIRVNTSATEHRPLEQLQWQRGDGAGWKRFGSSSRAQISDRRRAAFQVNARAISAPTGMGVSSSA